MTILLCELNIKSNCGSVSGSRLSFTISVTPTEAYLRQRKPAIISTYIFPYSPGCIANVALQSDKDDIIAAPLLLVQLSDCRP